MPHCNTDDVKFFFSPVDHLLLTHECVFIFAIGMRPNNIYHDYLLICLLIWPIIISLYKVLCNRNCRIKRDSFPGIIDMELPGEGVTRNIVGTHACPKKRRKGVSFPS